MQKGQSGKLNVDHRREEKQRIAETELARKPDQKVERPAPGKGKPVREEGLGTIQTQKR
jgi:hypothetical protein